VRILGIDPGFGILGWAVIEKDLTIVACGALQTPKEIPLEERIYRIHGELREIIQKYQPRCAALERVFFTKNVKTAMDVAKCIGAVLLTLRMEGCAFVEYTPTQVKQAMTGYGRADKEQMQSMVQRIFKIKEFPYPDDTADALAVAVCHSLSQKGVYAERIQHIRGNRE